MAKKYYGKRAFWTEVILADMKVAFSKDWADYEGEILVAPPDLLEPAAKKLQALLLLGSPREEAEAAVLEWLQEQVAARKKLHRWREKQRKRRRWLW